MDSIISFNILSKVIANLKKQKESIVLVGGCFDILHPGHVIFLEKAKRCADILIVLLESDKKVKKLKGDRRPVHQQKDRAKILSALRFTDYIVMLPYIDKEEEYDRIIARIRPDIIATASGYPNKYHQRSAAISRAQLKYVTKIIKNHSSSRILENETFR